MPYSIISARFCSQLSTMPWPGWAITTSDQRVRRRRSACGMSKRRGQRHRRQLHRDLVDPVERLADGQGIEDAAAPRSRISGSITARLDGETAGLTVLRCTSCLGGSMAMNMRGAARLAVRRRRRRTCRRWRCRRPAASTAARRACARRQGDAALRGEHLVVGVDGHDVVEAGDRPSAAAMSPAGVQCTGSSARRRSK